MATMIRATPTDCHLLVPPRGRRFAADVASIRPDIPLLDQVRLP